MILGGFVYQSNEQILPSKIIFFVCVLAYQSKKRLSFRQIDPDHIVDMILVFLRSHLQCMLSKFDFLPCFWVTLLQK